MSQPAPHKISKSTEHRLLGYLDKVAEYINHGDTPNQAIVKIARAYDIEGGHVRLLAQAYNNARTNQQRKSSDDLYEKIASFKLADVKEIINELYPQQIKTAAAREREEGVSDEYKYAPKLKIDVNPQFEKFTKMAAFTPPSALPRDPNRHVKKAHSLLKELNQNFEEKRRLVNSSRDKVAAAYDELLGYFKHAFHGVPFGAVRQHATAYWGRPADVLMNNVQQDLKIPNRGLDKFAAAMDVTKAPYTIIERCLKAIEKHAGYKADFQKFSKEASDVSSRLVEPFLPTPPKRIYGSIMKAAADKGDDGIGMGDIMGGPKEVLSLPPIQRSLSAGLGKSEGKLKTDAFTALTDPHHEAKLRGLRAQAMLTDMMANDPFLSGESPERVTGLYNQITKLSPRASDQPLLMRALLRRYLAQGQVDPHDVGQLADIEVKLKQRDEPQREYHLPKLQSDFTQTGRGPSKTPEE